MAQPGANPPNKNNAPEEAAPIKARKHCRTRSRWPKAKLAPLYVGIIHGGQVFYYSCAAQ